MSARKLGCNKLRRTDWWAAVECSANTLQILHHWRVFTEGSSDCLGLEFSLTVLSPEAKVWIQSLNSRLWTSEPVDGNPLDAIQIASLLKTLPKRIKSGSFRKKTFPKRLFCVLNFKEDWGMHSNILTWSFKRRLCSTNFSKLFVQISEELEVQNFFTRRAVCSSR